MKFSYTYVLYCVDQKFYIGSTGDLDRRIQEHRVGNVDATKNRRPVQLVYYETCLSKELAQQRERYFKTGYGREFLRKRITVTGL